MIFNVVELSVLEVTDKKHHKVGLHCLTMGYAITWSHKPLLLFLSSLSKNNGNFKSCIN